MLGPVNAATALGPVLAPLLAASSVRFEFWDGSAAGSEQPSAVAAFRTPNAIRRIVTAPGDLGLGRAYVRGEIDVSGDLGAILALGDAAGGVRIGARDVPAIARAVLAVGLRGRWDLTRPPEEARMRGRLHSRERDAAAIAHHYDVSNDFYRLVLGPTMTYSCAYFGSNDASLESAQTDKMELICRKLRLRPGERLLDVGCGWGSLAIHAAKHFGVSAVGVTLSERQADLAAKRVAEEGVADRVTIRLQDERDVEDGPYDAVASVGMFEHVGAERLAEYFAHLHRLLRPQGRLLNHGIANPPGRRTRFDDRGFGARYVFPDGELHEVGRVISVMQAAGFEVRDLEALREHYALTLRRWVANLEANRDECVRLVGEGRFRVWHLYMSVSARGFDRGTLQVHQVLGVKSAGGRSAVPLRRADIVLP